MTVVVRTDYGSTEVRALAKAAVTPEQARRLLAIALILDGASRAEAARSTGMDRQTLRDWVHRFNDAGPAGLVDRKAPGRQRRLDPEQQQELARCLEGGPELAQDGLSAALTSLRGIGQSPMVRWRLIDLCALSAALTSRRGIGRRPMVERRFGVCDQERGMGKPVRALGFSRVAARPQQPKSDPEARAEFKKNWPTGSPPPSAIGLTANGSRSGSRTRAG